MRYLILFSTIQLLLVGCSTAQAPDYSGLQTFYTQKLDKYLLKSDELKEYIIINSEAIFVFDTSDYIEFELPWEEVSLFKEILQQDPAIAKEWYDNNQKPSTYIPNERQPFKWDTSATTLPLKGLKIALDPGHIAGNMEMAVFEGKYVKMNMPSGQPDIALFESELNWYTTKYLQEKLQNLGAEVFLSRSRMGHTAFEMTYDDWYAQADTFPKPPKRKFFFSYFRHIDNDERVRKINEFQPDLTLVIHYNVDGMNKPWRKPSSENFSMAFVGGGFMKNELIEKERRFHFFRLLMSDDIEHSIDFSGQVLRTLQDSCKVNPVPIDGSQTYLKYNSIATNEPGVYARNLSLSSRIYGTLCYAEPLFQDSKEEVFRLNTKDYNFNGTMIPKRITEVADAYLVAILKYLKENT